MAGEWKYIKEEKWTKAKDPVYKGTREEEEEREYLAEVKRIEKEQWKASVQAKMKRLAAARSGKDVR